MKSRRPIALLATAASIAALAFVISCGSDNNNSGGGGVGPKELDSGTLPGGRVFTHTFASVGNFSYHCQVHPSMNGQVMVLSGGADSAFVHITGNTFTPTPVTVKPTGTVRWLNEDATNHTVTSN